MVCISSRALFTLEKEIEVFEKACPLFVPIAEEGWTHHPATYEIAEEYLKELREKNILFNSISSDWSSQLFQRFFNC